MPQKNIVTIKRLIIGICCVAALFLFLDGIGVLGQTVEYRNGDPISDTSLPKYDVVESAQGVVQDGLSDLAASSTATTTVVVHHLKTPEVVRAAYMTSCIASGAGLRAPLLALVEESEINALVIDVKDYTGYISMDLGNPEYPTGGSSCFVKDMKAFLAELGEKGVYRIARIAVMQDPYYAAKHTEDAVKRKDTGGVWKDKKGLAFVDPGAEHFWEYIRDVSVDAYDAGFDEINFDYVRYPTDGALHNMAFTLSGSSTKPAMMKKFFSYIGKEMKDRNIPSSVDIFGMTTTAIGDLGIGQVLEDILPHFDYIAPMVYPSHYPPSFNGWKDPNTVPGPLIEYVMGEAVRRGHVLGYGPEKFRTWIQDFDYGKDYTLADVRAQIGASERVGVRSYMVWDPSNKYTRGAYTGRIEEKRSVFPPTPVPVATTTASTTKQQP